MDEDTFVEIHMMDHDQCAGKISEMCEGEYPDRP